MPFVFCIVLLFVCVSGIHVLYFVCFCVLSYRYFVLVVVVAVVFVFAFVLFEPTAAAATGSSKRF